MASVHPPRIKDVDKPLHTDGLCICRREFDAFGVMNAVITVKCCPVDDE